MEAYAKRKALRTQVDTLPDLRRHRAKFGDELTKESLAWVEQAEGHKKQIAPLHAKIEALDTAIQAAEKCNRTLRETYVGPLLDALGKLENEAAAISRQITAAEKARNQHAADLNAHYPHGQCLSESDAKTLRTAIADCDKRIGELQTQRTAIERQQADLESQMLSP